MVPTSDERIPFTRVLLDVARASGGYIALAVVFLAPSCCLIGLPFFGVFAGRAYLRAMGVRRGGVSTWRLGVLGAPLFVVPVLGLAIAGSLLFAVDPESELPVVVRLCTSFSVSAAMGMMCFPLFGAPLEAADSAEGALDAILASGARAARMGLRTSLGTGAIVGVIGVLPWLLLPMAHRALVDENPTPWILVGLFVAMVASEIVCLGLVAHAHGEGLERFGHARTRAVRSNRAEPVHRPLTRSLALAASPLALLAPALLLAALTPAPAWRTARHATPGVPVDQAFEASGHGLSLENPEANLWVIATRDGGGAGPVRFRRPGDDAHATVARGTYRGREVYTLQVREYESVRLVSFDDEGVRVDDTPTDRVQARLGSIGVGVLFAHLLALAVLLVATLRRTGVAANLDRPWLGGYRDTVAILGAETKEAFVERVTRENVRASLPLLVVAIGLCVTVAWNL